MTVSRLVCEECDIRIEATFDLPALARLSAEDQLFVHAFVQSHGSIKEMGRLFSVSYPTVKNRLASITSQLGAVPGLDTSSETAIDTSEILDLLSQGEISVQEALKELSS